eukprot:6205175-Prymnesium_polylepis.1
MVKVAKTGGGGAIGGDGGAEGGCGGCGGTGGGGAAGDGCAPAGRQKLTSRAGVAAALALAAV